MSLLRRDLLAWLSGVPLLTTPPGTRTPSAPAPEPGAHLPKVDSKIYAYVDGELWGEVTCFMLGKTRGSTPAPNAHPAFRRGTFLITGSLVVIDPQQKHFDRIDGAPFQLELLCVELRDGKVGKVLPQSCTLTEVEIQSSSWGCSVDDLIHELNCTFAASTCLPGVRSGKPELGQFSLGE